MILLEGRVQEQEKEFEKSQQHMPASSKLKQYVYVGHIYTILEFNLMGFFTSAEINNTSSTFGTLCNMYKYNTSN